MLKYSKEVLEEKRFIRDQKNKLQYLKAMAERLKGKPIVHKCFLDQINGEDSSSSSNKFDENAMEEEESLSGSSSEIVSSKSVRDRQETVDSQILNPIIHQH